MIINYCFPAAYVLHLTSPFDLDRTTCEAVVKRRIKENDELNEAGGDNAKAKIRRKALKCTKTHQTKLTYRMLSCYRIVCYLIQY